MADYKRKSASMEYSGSSHDIWVMLRSALWGIVLSLLCFIALAVVINSSDMQESNISAMVQGIKLISIAVAGILASYATASKGWLKGGIAGLIYIIAALIITAIVAPASIKFNALLNDVLMAFVAGAISGIIGVTLKSK